MKPLLFIRVRESGVLVTCECDSQDSLSFIQTPIHGFGSMMICFLSSHSFSNKNSLEAVWNFWIKKLTKRESRETTFTFFFPHLIHVPSHDFRTINYIIFPSSLFFLLLLEKFHVTWYISTFKNLQVSPSQNESKNKRKVIQEGKETKNPTSCLYYSLSSFSFHACKNLSRKNTPWNKVSIIWNMIFLLSIVALTSILILFLP